MAKLHLKFSAGVTHEGTCVLYTDWVHSQEINARVKHMELKFLASDEEESGKVFDAYKQARALEDQGTSLIAIMDLRNTLGEANNRRLDYSEYLPIKLQEAKNAIQWAYAHAVAEGDKLGFTDEDWNVANQYVDELKKGVYR